MELSIFIPYLVVMAGVTYLIKMIPFVLVEKKIENRFINSLLYYIPYAVLAAMIFPGILFATGSIVSAAGGFLVAILVALRGKGLIVVAVCASATVFLIEMAMQLM